MELTLPSDVCDLSAPVDEALQAFAREWLGNHQCEVLWSWPESLGSPWRGPSGDPILPLYLPAGFDLGVRWLAHRHQVHEHWGMRRSGLSFSLLYCQPTRRPKFEYGWELDGAAGSMKFPYDKSVITYGIPIPALATVPKDAPPRLRAARAVVLCIEATP